MNEVFKIARAVMSLFILIPAGFCLLLAFILHSVSHKTRFLWPVEIVSLACVFTGMLLMTFGMWFGTDEEDWVEKPV